MISHRRPVSLQRDQVVADAGNPLDQVLAGRLVPAVNGVGVVGHVAILPDSITAGQGLYFRYAAPPHQQERQPRQARRPDETPLARRTVRHKGEILGKVEAPDVASAKAAAAIQFGLDEIPAQPDHRAGAWLSDGR